MQNVEFASSSCFSKLLEASSRWFLDLAPGCEAPSNLGHWFLLLLVYNSFYSWSKLLMFLVGNFSYSWATTPIALS